MFMAVVPRKLATWDSFKKVNNRVLDKIRDIVSTEEGCSKIVKCDLLFLVMSVNPPPMVSSVLNMFGTKDCSMKNLTCSLLD